MRTGFATVFLGLLALLVLSIPGSPVGADPPDEAPAGVVSSVLLEDVDRLSPCYTGCGGEIAPSGDVSYEQQVVDLVNAERAAQGLPPFKLVSGLRNAARYHAADMAQDDYFEHNTYDRVGGRLVEVCSLWSRIEAYYPGAYAENIAAGYPTPQSVMQGWMQSGGHRDSILSTDYREIGVGYSRGGGWRHYWVQDFGERYDVYPLVINREAATTDSVYVSLYLYGEEWDEMRLRNDDGAWSDWRAFAHSIDWTLACGVGDHAVWVEMRGGEETATSSDTISLLASPSLGDLPDEVRFFYSIPDGRLLPASVRVTPRNVGNGDPFTWRAVVTGPFFQGSPSTGSDGDSFQVLPAGFDRSVAGTYTGAVTVAVDDLEGVDGSPQRIDLTLRIIDASFEEAYLPLASKGSAP